jgi:hypothetical protein
MWIVPLGVEAKLPRPSLGVRPGRHQDEEGREVRQLEQDGEQLDRCRIRPVDVLHRQDERLAGRQRLDESPTGHEQLRLERAGIEVVPSTAAPEVHAQEMADRRLEIALPAAHELV